MLSPFPCQDQALARCISVHKVIYAETLARYYDGWARWPVFRANNYHILALGLLHQHCSTGMPRWVGRMVSVLCCEYRVVYSWRRPIGSTLLRRASVSTSHISQNPGTNSVMPASLVLLFPVVCLQSWNSRTKVCRWNRGGSRALSIASC